MRGKEETTCDACRLVGWSAGRSGLSLTAIWYLPDIVFCAIQTVLGFTMPRAWTTLIPPHTAPLDWLTAKETTSHNPCLKHSSIIFAFWKQYYYEYRQTGCPWIGLKWTLFAMMVDNQHLPAGWGRAIENIFFPVFACCWCDWLRECYGIVLLSYV